MNGVDTLITLIKKKQKNNDNNNNNNQTITPISLLIPFLL